MKETYIGDFYEEKLLRDLDDKLHRHPCPYTEKDCVHRDVWCIKCEVNLKDLEEHIAY